MSNLLEVELTSDVSYKDNDIKKPVLHMGLPLRPEQGCD